MSTKGYQLYPVFIDLAGAAVLVVGGGSVAARKVPSLLAAGAAVTVVAPRIDPAIIRVRGPAGRAKIVRRAFRPRDVHRQKLIFAATGDPALNRRIAAAARRARILVNVAAPPEAGDIQIPSVVRRGRLSIAISTGGASAALAAALRVRLERTIGPEWTGWLNLLEQTRRRILKKVSNAAVRRKLLQNLGNPRWAARVKKLGLPRVRAEVNKIVDAHRHER